MGSDGQKDVPDREAEDPDLTLVRAIAAGEQAAFAMLVDRHLDRVVRLAARLMQNPADAEDVAQDVFARVWRHAKNWQPGKARYTTWLHRVTVNLCHDRLRKRREVSLDAVAEMPADAPLADQVLQDQNVARQVRTAIDQLPERQRLAIVLCHLEEMGNKEAAAIMDISVEAMESLLARGRRTLKTLLVDEKSHLIGGGS